MGTLIVRPNTLMWTPSLLSIPPLYWFDAADESSLTLVGSNVSEWVNKGSVATSLTQSTDSLRPTYSATGLNGNPTLNWGTSANSKRLFTSQVVANIPKSIFVLAEYDGVEPFNRYYGLITSSNRIFYTTEEAPAYPGYSWVVDSFALLALNYYNGSLSNSGMIALPTISDPFVLAGYASSYSVSMNGLVVGMDRSNGGRGWIGKISEILILDYIPSDKDKTRIVNYLITKRG